MLIYYNTEFFAGGAGGCSFDERFIYYKGGCYERGKSH